MIDVHFIPVENWGIHSILFNIMGMPISAYTFFVMLGVLVGLAVYYYEAKKYNQFGANSFNIILGALIGGTIGAKILDWAIEYKYFFQNIFSTDVIFYGRTIVGGLIGGTIGVNIVKKILGTKEKKGNFFAPAIAIGVAIGRLGCFFVGCCYGKATSLPWGVNFGDGILRHPTQLYESLFMFGMFFYLLSVRDKDKNPGRLFKILMVLYFTFRFFIEFIRVNNVVLFGLTAFQIISLFVIIYLTRNDTKNLYLILKNKILYGRKQNH